MQKQSQKLENLRKLNEAEFREDVLIPLLKKMGYEKVRERHGTQEYGKDITFYESSKLSNTYYAVVAKAGKISGAASGNRNLSTINTQIDQAFMIPFEDVEDKKKHHIDRVIVWTTDSISNNAQKQILAQSSTRYRPVDFKDGQATIELLEKYYPAFFTIRDPIVSEYYNRAKGNYAVLEDLRTLGTSENSRPLSIIFVPPTFSEITEIKIEKNHLKYKKDKNKWYLNQIEVISDNLILTGDAGSGKTTVLRKLFLSVIKNNEKESKREPIPILVRIKKFDFSLENPIQKLIKDELERFNCQDLSDELASHLTTGSIAIFLDGLDELETKEKIDKAFHNIKHFSETYKKVKIIITSRHVFLLEEMLNMPNFRMFRINELEPTQMVKFVENWYGQGTELCRKLVDIIIKKQSLKGLPATPLTLALIAILHESSPWKEAPANKTELFSKYIELALGRWDASKDISVQFEYSIKKFILQQISWDMHERNEVEINFDDFETLIDLLAEEYGLRLDIDVFCKEVIERSELLFKTHKNSYEFKHRSFQDYFVGLEINRQPNSTEIIASKFLEPWWYPAIFFAGGLTPDHEEYIQAILEKGPPPRPKSLFYAKNLGELVQATFMITKKTKLKVVRLVLEQLIESWQHFCDFWNTLENKPIIIKEMSPHILFLLIHASVSQIALGSVTLSPVLSELANEYLNIYSDISGSSDHEIIRSEWRLFLLASACAECDENINDFYKIFQSQIIYDPSFLIVGAIYAKEISDRTWLEDEITALYKKLSKKLAKKSSDHPTYWKELKNKNIIALHPL